jgi:hypothetical protein
VGFGGFTVLTAKQCACWNARFALDLYARSFVTELSRFRVAVLASNGNLIMRVGEYGNVDDGVPLVKVGGPSSPRSLAEMKWPSAVRATWPLIPIEDCSSRTTGIVAF